MPATPPAGQQMKPPAPFPPQPAPSAATLAAVAAALVLQLAAYGLTDTYTASTCTFAVISVTACLTVWTDSRQLWCTIRGQRHTWPAADLAAAAADIAALTCP